MMNIGKLRQPYLERAVFPFTDNIENVLQDANVIMFGPGIGHDYAVADGIITADGSGEAPEIAFYKALNNFSCSLGVCQFARIQMLLPESVKESKIKEYMQLLATLAREHDISIVGGDTQILEQIQSPHFIVNLWGSGEALMIPDSKQVQEGYDIVCVGWNGILGINQYALKHKEDLRSAFSETFINQAKFPVKQYSIQKAIDVISDNDTISACGISYLHDVSEGGIYQALWQVGEALHKGMRVRNGAILFRQETIEIAELLELNPYQIDGTGSMLVVCEKGNTLVKLLEDREIPAKIIGQITKGKERLVWITDKDIRTLTPF